MKAAKSMTVTVVPWVSVITENIRSLAYLNPVGRARVMEAYRLPHQLFFAIVSASAGTFFDENFDHEIERCRPD